MRCFPLSILLGLSTCLLNPSIIKAESADNTSNATSNQQDVSNDGNLDQYFNRNADESRDSNQPLSAQAPAEETAPATDESATTTTPPATPTQPGSTGTTPAKKGVKKRKKKAATSATTPGTAVDAATGHGAQDSGLPYKANFDLEFKFASQNITTKYEDLSAKSTITEMGLDVTWLFIFSSMEAGPRLAYSSKNTKSDDETAKESSMGFGGAFFMNFGNIQADKLVPYAGASVMMNTQTNDDAKTTRKMTDLGLQGGMKYFVGAHLALKPFLSYEMTLSGEDKREVGSDTSVGSVTGSTLKLGVGLAKYF